MIGPQIFRIVDNSGNVLHSKLTSEQADAFMPLLLANGKYSGIRSERMDAPVSTPPAPAAPPIVAQVLAEANPLPEIEPGREREALRKAIEARADAAKRIADATQAVDRAKAFLTDRQAEHAALTVAYEGAVRANASRMAEFFKGDATAVITTAIDEGALRASETKLATAEAVVRQLEAERDAAESIDRGAANHQHLCIVAVKRRHAEALVDRLEAVKAEFTALVAAIDAARFAAVPATLRSQQAIHIDLSQTVTADADVKRWHAFGAALAENPDAEYGEAQR
jgi:hypothetical protein